MSDFKILMISEQKRAELENQGYRIVGNHSAIKACMWTKRSIKNCGVCYKNTFYGIESHRCVQMTPALPFCTHRCVWCWRDIDHTTARWEGPIDEPKDIVEGCVIEHVKFLVGFGGNPKADPEKFSESQKPLHFAISLSGEPAIYPRLGELIEEINRKGMTSFLVTNGTFPKNLKKLIGFHEPTQLYITLPAPNEEIYKISCGPLISEGWKQILESLSLLKDFKCRTTIRLTLVKDVNMILPELYGKLVEQYSPDFVEVKGYVWVGYSRQRLKLKNMPTHEDILSFAGQISDNSSYKLIDEKVESKVVLLMKGDSSTRKLEFKC